MTDAVPRRILLAVSGMSPQIITETLYALVTQPDPWIPHEIHLITTGEGRNRAKLQLLQGNRHFQELLRDYAISEPIHFEDETIHIIRDTAGLELPDLRTPQENEAAADCICEKIREFTDSPNTELHVSLAGGRKTMGFYAGYALSLFGREQDRLSHVLVSESYESNRDFYYPTPVTRVIYDRDGQPLDAHLAEVWLAEIPFVRLRNSLPPSLLAGTHSFSRTVELARRATEKPRLTLQPGKCTFQMNGVTGRLGPNHMALLLWAAVRHRQGRVIDPVVCADDDRSQDLQELLTLADKHWVDITKRTSESLEKTGLTQEWLEQNISKLNKKLREALGPELAERCKLASGKHGRNRSYALPTNLEIEIE